MRADEAAAAGDQDAFHGRPPLRSSYRQAVARPSRQWGSVGVQACSERRIEHAGRGAGRSSSSLAIGTTRAGRPAWLMIAEVELVPAAVAGAGEVIGARGAALDERERGLAPGGACRWGSRAGRRRPAARGARRPGAAWCGRSSCRAARTPRRYARRARRMLLAHGELAGELGRAVDRAGRRRVGLDVAAPRGRPRRRSRSSRRRVAAPAAWAARATLRVPVSLTRKAPSGSHSAPSTSVQAAQCTTSSGRERSIDARPRGVADVELVTRGASVSTVPASGANSAASWPRPPVTNTRTSGVPRERPWAAVDHRSTTRWVVPAHVLLVGVVGVVLLGDVVAEDEVREGLEAVRDLARDVDRAGSCPR